MDRLGQLLRSAFQYRMPRRKRALRATLEQVGKDDQKQ
jgi:hypothetical protein